MSTFTEADIDDSESLLWTEKQSYASMISTIGIGVLLIPFGLGILILVNVYTTINYTSYAVTDKALYKKKGVFSESLTRVPLTKIQNTEYSRSWAEKKFGHGTVEISTAGSSGAQLRFRAIPDPKSVQEKINSLTKDVSSAESHSSNSTQVAEELKATRENIEEIIKYMEN